MGCRLVEAKTWFMVLTWSWEQACHPYRSGHAGHAGHEEKGWFGSSGWGPQMWSRGR